ncbi:MAG: hypothetical protein ACXADS_15295 [Candidatus Thorarchaeota archaeon]|jgi:hypothetical protein
MRPSQLHDELVKLFEIKRPVCIEGPPGGGKTSVCRKVKGTLQEQKNKEIGYIEVHVPTTLVEDFGMPWPTAEEKRFGYKLPWWWPIEGQCPDEGIICFDDRGQAEKPIQKVIANVQQARNLHGHKLPDGWQVLSTGNRKQDNAGAGSVLGHLRDRENVIEYETHLDDSTKWALEHGVSPELIAFWRFCPDLLHAYDPQKDCSPTPRSWVEGVSDLMGVVGKDAEHEWFKGAVGAGAAAEFCGFLDIYRQLPDPDEIIKSPTAGTIPTDPATLYALCGALSYRADTDNFGNIIQYLDRCPPEFSVLCVTMAISKNEDLTSTTGFIQWGANNMEVLF